jgi:serine/threonine-protein kinase HipA
MIQVWTSEQGNNIQPSGVLDRLSQAQTTFAYTPNLQINSAVSLTMPVRVKSWEWTGGVAPIFEMNLPEGALRQRLERNFAKATGRFDDLDLLAIVGRNQIGRMRYSGIGETLDESVPFQSVDEILRARRSDGFFDYLMEQFAQHSGVAGAQPKVLIRDHQKLSAGKSRQSSSIIAATHIVKMWDVTEFPQLAANEYFCLTAASRLGFTVPPFSLSDSGDALIVERFDVSADGSLGFEDFCVLNGRNTRRKYDGSVETSLFKRLSEFSDPQQGIADAKTLFALVVLNCAIGNGDAHLKNFGVLYDAIDAPVRLAPIFDLVTTTVYLPNDQMALTLDGTTRWPTRKRLMHLGRTRAALTSPDVTNLFEETICVLMDLRPEVTAWFAASPNPEVGTAMIARWEAWAREID